MFILCNNLPAECFTFLWFKFGSYTLLQLTTLQPYFTDNCTPKSLFQIVESLGGPQQMFPRRVGARHFFHRRIRLYFWRAVSSTCLSAHKCQQDGSCTERVLVVLPHTWSTTTFPRSDRLGFSPPQYRQTSGDALSTVALLPFTVPHEGTSDIVLPIGILSDYSQIRACPSGGQCYLLS